MAEDMEGDEGNEIRMIARCADCGRYMVEGHPLYPPLCRACGEGMRALIREQWRVLAGERSDWPGECHVDVQCGPFSDFEDEHDRRAVTVPELLARLWDAWHWWFEGDDHDSGVAA